MAKGKLKIHSENILPIIKSSLYSDKDIFIRELVSNACDAISKLKFLRDQGQTDFKDEDIRIDIKLNKEEKTLRFIDNGIGMSKDEVENYIAHLAFSGAQDFFEKYKSKEEKDQIIGHFGLGFYSSFMVSHLVDIQTKSYDEQAGSVFWSSDGSYEYTIDKGSRDERGTDICLHIDQDSEEFLEEGKVKEILRKYCSYLPYPIYFNEEKINEKEPLWLKPASECSDQEYIDFYKQMYPFEPDPIFWVHLNVDYPFHLKGILYFPKITKQFDYQKSHIQLFCNRVFVSDNCKDLIPEHLMVLRGAIDSPDIPLNVSRSYLQMDKTVRSLSSHVSKKISDRLNKFYQNDRDGFLKAWPDIEMIIKLGCLHDEKFYDRVKPFLVWQTTNDEWMTAEEYQEKNEDKYSKKIFYTSHEKKQSHFLHIYEEKGIDVLVAKTALDTPLMNLIESKNPNWKFQRIDAEVHDSLVDSSKEKTVLDAEGKTESSKIAEVIRSYLDEQNIEVEAKSLASNKVPGFVMIDEQSRRMRDYLSLSQQDIPKELAGKQTFVVNTNNPLICAMYRLSNKNPELSKELTRQIYELSLLGQRELKSDDLGSFIERSNQILEKLTEEITK